MMIRWRYATKNPSDDDGFLEGSGSRSRHGYDVPEKTNEALLAKDKDFFGWEY
jgi:hypothetical protein